MIERWTRWEPLQHVSQNYYAVAITDDHDGFKILLSNDKNTIKNSFIVTVVLKKGIDTYRITKKNLRLQTIKMLNENYGSNFYVMWPFFKIINSHYMQWLGYESSEISYTRNFSHFVVITSNLILDIVSPLEPLVDFIDQPNLDE